MIFTQQSLREFLLALGIPAWGWQLADDEFETVSDEFVAEVWAAWIASLKANAPELLEVREIGGGKTRLLPKWRKNGGDCENISLICFGHEQTGNWIDAVRTGATKGRTYGITFFESQPRAENGHVAGGHCVIWYINHAGQFRVFEPQLGSAFAWLPAEFASAGFGLAA